MSTTYNLAFRILHGLYKRGFAIEELAMLLGAMALTDEGTSMDPAIIADWNRAEKAAGNDDIFAALKIFIEDYNSRTTPPAEDLSDLAADLMQSHSATLDAALEVLSETA